MFRITKQNILTPGAQSELVNRKNRTRASSSESIKQVVLGEDIEGKRGFWDNSTAKDAKLLTLIKRASIAYLTDALLRASVDKYSENFRDFELIGDPEKVSYLESRLNQISLRSGEHWKTLFCRAINEYFKTGNSFIVKIRGANYNSSPTRALYKDKPYPIAMLHLISADKLKDCRDQNKAFIGWKLGESSDIGKIRLTLPSSVQIPGGHLLELPNLDLQDGSSKGSFLRPGLDVVQLAYKKGASSVWGVGMTLMALEDISFLRAIEQSTSIMIKKFSKPIIHHKITRAPGPMRGEQEEIDKAYMLYRKMAPDGVIITGGNTDIKAIGSESQAMRVEGYLRYFLDRCFSGLGVSQSLMGIGSMSMGAAEAAQEMMLTKVRFCQKELARELEFFILNELLWEGGWDPYNNPEERVRIDFVAIDEDREIKMRTHAADLFQKNIVGLQEARNIGKIEGPIPDEDLYINKIRGSEIDHETRGNIQVVKAKPVSTPKGSSERFKSYIRKYIPQDEGGLEEFFDELRFHFKEQQLQPLFDRIEALLGDSDAIAELLVQELF